MIFSYMIFVNHKSIDNEIVIDFTNILKRNLERKSFKENWLWQKEKQNSFFKKLEYILAKIYPAEHKN